MHLIQFYIVTAGKLTQQYIVDIHTKVEGDRLQYIRQNQNQLRVELYSGLMDYLKKIITIMNNFLNTRIIARHKTATKNSLLKNFLSFD